MSGAFLYSSVASELVTIQAALGMDLDASPVVAVIGDSLGKNNTVNTAPNFGYSAIGFMTWWRILSGQRINFPLSHNLAVSGTAIATHIDQAVAVCSLNPKPRFCVYIPGANDWSTSGNGTSLATMKAGLTTIFNTLMAAGIQPIIIPSIPRASLTTNSGRTRAAFNVWLRELCWGRTDLTAGLTVPGGPRLPILVDPIDAIVDVTTGAMQSAMTIDGTHLTIKGAYTIGKALNDAVTPMLFARPTRTLEANDIYDATYAPGGSVLSASGVNRGLFAGTGGTKSLSTGVTPTGNVATTWTMYRIIGSAPLTTFAGSKENPRTDVANGGERQRMQVAVSGAGTNEEHYGLYNSGLNVAAGDQVYAECAFSVAAPTNLRTIQLQISEGGTGAAGSSPQTAYDGYFATGNPTYGLLPSVAISGVLRTPPITLQTGANQFNVQIRAIMKTDDGLGDVDLYASDAVVRRVV